MIKYGIKLWSTNKHWFKEARELVDLGKVDFIELYFVPESVELKEIELLKNSVLTVHSPTCQHNFNIFQLDDSKVQLFKDQVTKTADFLGSSFIIVHGGIGEKEDVFKENIAKIYDKRILMENMPKIALNSEICFGHSLEQLKFMRKQRLNFCLDFTHAIKSAVAQKLDYKKFIESLISELNPHYFHISGGEKDNLKDEHLNLWEGDFEVGWIKSQLNELSKKRDMYLVFEVPKEKNLENDIKNICYFKKL